MRPIIHRRLPPRPFPSDTRARVSLRRVLFLLACVSLTAPRPARAVDLTLKLEPGLALPLGAPQGQIFGAGGQVTVKGALGLTRWLSAQLTLGFDGFPANANGGDSGYAWTFGAG